MNRDYFTTPIQGGRSAHDYGNTHIDVEKPLSIMQIIAFLICAGVFITIMAVGSAVMP